MWYLTQLSGLTDRPANHRDPPISVFPEGDDEHTPPSLTLKIWLKLSCFCDRHFTDSPQPSGRGLLPTYTDKETKDQRVEHLSPTALARKCLSQKVKFGHGHLCLSCSVALHFGGCCCCPSCSLFPHSELPERAILVMSLPGGSLSKAGVAVLMVSMD